MTILFDEECVEAEDNLAEKMYVNGFKLGDLVTDGNAQFIIEAFVMGYEVLDAKGRDPHPPHENITARVSSLKLASGHGGKLLPCPFCNGVAKSYSFGHLDREGCRNEVYAVTCQKCGVTIDGGRGYFDEESDAIFAWNTRIESSATKPHTEK